MFWTIFLFFYAGSYNYGADVRYSLMSYVPIAVLAGAGIRRLTHALDAVHRGRWSDRAILAATIAVILAQSMYYLPLVRATGEEAWAARADVKYAKAFAERLPPNAIVLTHNPSMFHIWGINAAQLSLAMSDTAFVSEALHRRFAGGVYVHWSFWCNVNDPTQVAFCRSVLARFPHELVEARREREYEYALYRLIDDKH
jgi:hypothetical protein